MIFKQTPLLGAYTIELEKRSDERGFFARVFCEKEFKDHKLADRFVQVNNSLATDRGTLRGMHYQLGKHAEVKLVRCIQGALHDVIIDLRENSSTFGQHYATTLTAENRKMLYVPKGFAHGFITLEPNTEAFYFADNFYSGEAEGGVRWNDPKFKIDWPLKDLALKEPSVISDKDRNHDDFDPEKHVRLWKKHT